MKNVNYLALKYRCKHEHDYMLNRFDRIFYTIKFMICWNLKRQPKECQYDGIHVACFNFRNDFSLDAMNAKSWDYIRVGPGYFTNWWAYCGDDSNY